MFYFPIVTDSFHYCREVIFLPKNRHSAYGQNIPGQILFAEGRFRPECLGNKKAEGLTLQIKYLGQ